jgi:cation diffusion facilitator CzcD-associated flavoprotein CzcO
MSRPSTNDVAIVGAGPYGLSVAAHLRRARPAVPHLRQPHAGLAGELLAARSVVIAIGISHFRHVPQRLARLLRELVSHTSHQRSFGEFSGRDATAIGGRQSALETAALAGEQGARPRPRAPAQVGLERRTPPRASSTGAAAALSTTGLGDGWWLRLYANLPGTFHRLPARMRVHAVRTALGPAGAWWLKERVLGQLPVLTGHTVVGAEADGNRLHLRVQQETIADTDKLSATKRVELCGMLSTKPGLHRYLRVTPQGCCASTIRRSRPRSTWTASTCCAAPTPSGRRGHRARVQAAAPSRTRLAAQPGR